VASSPDAPHVFELTGGELCLDFANTVGHRTNPDQRVDHLQSYRDLVSWAEQTRSLSGTDADALLRAGDRRPQAARRAFERAIRLREGIYDVLSAHAAGRVPREASLEPIGYEAAIAAAHRRIARAPDAGFAWTWQLSPEDLDRPLWPVALSAAEILTSARLKLVRECALKTCGWLFLDTSRNQTRRWCDMRVCGNRAKVRRFYNRTRNKAEA
jgi:predicted RNA-binding Zn ribbon-like protein